MIKFDFKCMPVVLLISALLLPTAITQEGNVVGTIVKIYGKVVRVNKNLGRRDFLEVGSKIYESDIVGSG